MVSSITKKKLGKFKLGESRFHGTKVKHPNSTKSPENVLGIALNKQIVYFKYHMKIKSVYILS